MTVLASRLVAAIARTGSIICYHGIASDDVASTSGANIPLEEFKATLDVARGIATIVPLRELVDRHRAGRSTAGLLAVTFDDGYAALLRHVAPLLNASQIPATVFVATGFAKTAGSFWWDRLGDLVPYVPADRWSRFEQEIGLPSGGTRGERQLDQRTFDRLRRWILAEHRGRWPERLEPALSRLESEVGRRTEKRAMSFEELAELMTIPLFDLGVHTRSHPVLPLLDEDEAREEIDGGLRELAEAFDRVQPLLGIPFGIFDRRTARLAREAGIVTSFSAESLTLARCVEPEILPRFVITRGQKGWKLLLRLAGIVERVRGRSNDGYAAVPSTADAPLERTEPRVRRD